MPAKLNTICKTVYQHNREPISEPDMRKLWEIAEAYGKVKNYVYRRYGGIGGLPKIYPGYTVQNEMTGSGLREQLGLPSAYFYPAVFDALGDIKNQWTQAKGRIRKAIGNNENLSLEEGHYLRFVLKVSNCLEAILNDEPVRLPKDLQAKYEEIMAGVEVHRLNNYLKRQVRRHLRRPRTDRTAGFSLTERAYRYGDHGIYISTKEKRRRIFVPLTDSNTYTRQLHIKLHKDSGSLEILVPVNVRIKRHEDFQNEVGLSAGMFTMLTTDTGNTYGDRLGEFVTGQAEWIQEQTRIYRKNRGDNPGRKRYTEQKRRRDERLHTYINTELNRFFREEKPKVVYLPKFPGQSRAGKVKRFNLHISMWQRGYILERLRQKCREQSVEMIEVLGKDIGSECSRCGGSGEKKNGGFCCPSCGFQTTDKINAARNAKRRGAGGYGRLSQPG